MILDEESFVELFLRRGLRQADIHEQFDIPKNTLTASARWYRDQYRRELKEAQSKNYARAAYKRPVRKKDKPDVILPEAELRKKAALGKKISVIAAEMNTSEWFVLRNLEMYGIVLSPELPYRMQHVDPEFLHRLEYLTPGFREAAHGFYDDPHAYYLKLHAVLGELVDLQRFVKDQSSGHGYYVEHEKIPRDHICWNTNWHETLLSRALLREGIPHMRQVALHRAGFLFDFWIDGTDVAVEVDGSFHTKDTTTIARDARKNAFVAKEGICLLRFTTSQVEEDVNKVVACIKASLSAR